MSINIDDNPKIKQMLLNRFEDLGYSEYTAEDMIENLLSEMMEFVEYNKEEQTVSLDLQKNGAKVKELLYEYYLDISCLIEILFLLGN